MRALVLSGGGNKGSYQVGALKYLISDLGYTYDILCGVSVGALNCAHLSMYPKEQEKEGFDYLFNFWNNVTQSQVYKRWFPFGRLHALWKQSLYNSQPLIDLIHKSILLEKVRASGKKVTVGAVSLTTGQYTLFDQNNDNFVDGVLASSSFPAGLKPILIDNQLWSDGGIKHITPLKAAIDMGATEIDMIICAPVSTTAPYDASSKTITLALRAVDLMSDQIIAADLKIAEQYNKLVLSGCCANKKYVKINIIRPEQDLIEDSLNFDHNEVIRMINIGYEDAKKQYVIKE